MLEVRQINAGEWREIKALRLHALDDTPYALGSTLAAELQYDDELCMTRTRENARGVRSTCAVALSGQRMIGLAVGVRNPDDIAIAHLYAVYVRSECRGTGAARRLTTFVADRARAGGALHMYSAVAESNTRAIAFYRKLGFECLGAGTPNEIPLRIRL